MRATWLAILLAVFMSGCNESTPTAVAPPYQGVTLSVGALGDAGILEAVRVQVPEWSSRTGAEIVVEPANAGGSAPSTADILVFSGDRLGALVDEGALAQIPESVVRPVEFDAAGEPAGDDKGDDSLALHRARDPLDFNDVAQSYRELVSKYGDTRFALPLGGTALVLVRRRDAFHSEPIRGAAESAGVSLKPPETWDEFDAQARFMNKRDWNGDGKDDHGIAFAVAKDADRLLESIYLARAGALGQPPDQFALLFNAETMAGQLESPPFLEALDQTAALKACGPPGMTSFDGAAARAAFRTGQVAMLIDRAERAAAWSDPQIPFAVEVCPLPASPRVFDPARQTWITPSLPNRVAYLPSGGGWLVGVSPKLQGRALEAAWSFAQMLASPETSQAIVSDPAFPMTPVRLSHLALGLPNPSAAQQVDSRAWGLAVDESFNATRVIVGLRIPGVNEYLDELGTALRAAIAGELEPKDALARANAAWNARSKSLGIARQLWHYRRSLNRLSTTNVPPPKS